MPKILVSRKISDLAEEKLKKEFDVTSDTNPFCSKRCSYIDLNNWLGEKYSIRTNEDDYEKDV